MCKICEGDYQDLKSIHCVSCLNLREIPFIEGLEDLVCYHCPLLESIAENNSLIYLEIDYCPSISIIPRFKKLRKLLLGDNMLVRSIPHIEYLEELYCIRCGSLEELPKFKYLKHIELENCTSLKIIPKLTILEEIKCQNCPLLVSPPIFKKLDKDKFNIWGRTFSIYLSRKYILMNCPSIMYYKRSDHLPNNLMIFTRIEKSDYFVSKRMQKLYNNIYYLWKRHQLKKYILHLQKKYYSNPELPYMKYYIENELYNENTKNFRMGYINDEEELVWYKIKK
jgi:hypothetical protein